MLGDLKEVHSCDLNQTKNETDGTTETAKNVCEYTHGELNEHLKTCAKSRTCVDCQAVFDSA